MASINGDTESLIAKKRSPAKKKGSTAKAVAFVVIGGLTLVYCIAELLAALYLGSLTLLSDGFHNLSDVVSLYIAYWAQAAAQRDLSKDMSYGWARSEILGGMTNGCFLLSLCLYVSLEAIPRLIEPETTEELTKEDGGYLFIGIAGIGLVLNIVGTIVFAIVGVSHGHSHSHGHGHGHGHGAKDTGDLRPQDPAASLKNVTDVEHEHGHEHKKKDKSHKHEHGHSDVEKKKKNKEHSHAHGEEHDHDHAHGEKKKDKKHKHKHEHDDHDEKDHKHKEKGMDMNTKAVFLHFLGDAISSLCVLATGFVLRYFSHTNWIKYLDPIASLLIVGIILITTVPLVKRCSMILLQSVPSEVDLDAVTAKTSRVDGVVSVHDLHVWQLVDGMIIASVHLMIAEGTDVGNIVYQVKQIFHGFGIHSSAIQPEFVKSLTHENFCIQNCVEECEEDWCCKKTADKRREEDYSSYRGV